MNGFDFFYGNKSKSTLPDGYEQTLEFSTCVEAIDEAGRWTSDTYTRKVEITYLGKEFSQYAFHVSCDDIFYQLKHKVKLEYDLLMEIDETFDELVVLVDLEGNIVKISNFNFIKERWRYIKTQLSKDYDDAHFQQLCEYMDGFVLDEPGILEHVKSPSVYGLYFNGYWAKHAYDKPQIKTIRYGNEAQNICLVENRDFQYRETPEQQYIEIICDVKATPEYPDLVKMEGKCQYIDGILYQHSKKLTLTHKTITYTAKWDGLRKRIL